MRVEGLEPDAEVELRATWADWTSATRLRADGEGRAVAGAEVVTAMRPPEGGSPDFFPADGRNRIALSVRDGDETLAGGELVREFAAAPTELTLRDDGLAGLYFESEEPRGMPVVALGGSEGGYEGMYAVASALARAGHPVLSLGYFGAPGLPPRLERVPVATVALGVAWLRREAGGPVALLGTSRGGELALLAASLDPTLAGAVIALVPSSRVQLADGGGGVSWTWGGKPVEPRMRIPVERIESPLLVAGGGQDSLILSRAYANEVAKYARDADLRVYDGAGHAIGLPVPWLPPTPTNLTGGTPQDDEVARQDLWPRILALLGD